MLVKQILEDNRRLKTFENLFGKEENHLEKIVERNQTHRSQRKSKQFQEKRFGTLKVEDKSEFNKSNKNPFRTKDCKMEEIAND